MHVSLHLPQKIILNVDIVLSREAASQRVEHTLMPSTWSSANYCHAGGRGTHVRPAEFLKEPIVFGHEVGEKEIGCRKGHDLRGMVSKSLLKLRCQKHPRWPHRILVPQ